MGLHFVYTRNVTETPQLLRLSRTHMRTYIRFIQLCIALQLIQYLVVSGQLGRVEVTLWLHIKIHSLY